MVDDSRLRQLAEQAEQRGDAEAATLLVELMHLRLLARATYSYVCFDRALAQGVSCGPKVADYRAMMEAYADGWAKQS